MSKTADEKSRDRYRMLRRIYEETDGSERTLINFSELAEQEGFDDSYANDMLIYLNSEGLLGNQRASGDLSLSHRGVQEIEHSLRYPESPTEHFSSNIIQNFSGPVYGGVQAGGQNNTQYISVSINPSLEEAVKNLTQLVHRSGASELDKEEAVQALERIRQLSQKDKTPDVVKLAKDKLDIVKTIFDVGKVGAEVIAPYLNTLAGYFI